MVEDGYIRGQLSRKLDTCPRCGRKVHVIYIERVDLPEGITWEATILKTKPWDQPIWGLGLECGDYARFHRQIAHIKEKMRLHAAAE